MTSSYAFSQTATDTTKIALEKPIARLVIKDLVAGDQAKAEVKVLNELINVKDSTIIKLNEVVDLRGQRISNLELMVSTTEQKFKTQQQLTQELQTALRKEKRKNFFYKLGSGGLIVGLSALLILGN